jgi:ABC-type sugar transport system permease subunit
MLRNVTYAVVALWLVDAMQVFGLVQSLAGPAVPEHVETLATYQYAISFNARDNLYMMGRGAAVAVVLVVLIVALVAGARGAFGRREIEY